MHTERPSTTTRISQTRNTKEKRPRQTQYQQSTTEDVRHSDTQEEEAEEEARAATEEEAIATSQRQDNTAILVTQTVDPNVTIVVSSVIWLEHVTENITKAHLVARPIDFKTGEISVRRAVQIAIRHTEHQTIHRVDHRHESENRQATDTEETRATTETQMKSKCDHPYRRAATAEARLHQQFETSQEDNRCM